MGCTSSKRARRSRSPSPFLRSQSMPIHSLVDPNHHKVNLTSSTLGSLRLESEVFSFSDEETMTETTNDAEWSEMINKSIPKTPTKTPTDDPEIINTWELMEGLEDSIMSYKGIVKERIIQFQRKIDAKKMRKGPPNGEKKVVLYFTSLRGIRKTYEDCFVINAILKGYGVKIDERDVSMHGGFKKELNEILGVGFRGARLPRVFTNGKYLGGADEVKQMHESGDLGKELEECEVAVVGKGGGFCEMCGDVRFVPCETCSGSCKVFVKEEEIVEEDEEVMGGGFRRCPDCNENGLVRCRICL